MGASKSRLDKLQMRECDKLQMREELEILEMALTETQRPIDYDDEASAGAHLTLNTLRNAYYHCQSSRRGRLRSAAVEKFVCTGARPSVSAVRFDADVLDIDTRQVVGTVDIPKQAIIKNTKRQRDEDIPAALRIVVAK